MSDLIPFIREQEVEQIWEEIAGKTIFDRTICLGKAMVVVVCFVTYHWLIQHRLVHLLMPLIGEEVASRLPREVIQVFQVDYQVGASAFGLYVRQSFSEQCSNVYCESDLS